MKGRYYLRIRGDLPPTHPASRLAVIALEIRGDRVVLLLGAEEVAFASTDDLGRWIRDEPSAGGSA